ncbi:MAG: hypothetical protein ACLR6B_09895 [Blautia sp.]
MNNAQGDQSNCATIAAKLKNDGCDLDLCHRYSGGSGLCQ